MVQVCDISTKLGIKVLSERGECFDPVEYMMLPSVVDGEGWPGCVEQIEVPLGVLIVFYYCNTTSCHEGAYIRPATDSLRPVIQQVLRKLWQEYVEEVETGWWDGEWWEVKKWKKEPEDVVEKKCEDMWMKARLPLRRLRELLKQYARRAVEEVERARREIEAFIEEVERARESGELELEAAEELQARARRTLDLLLPELELDQ